MVSKAGVIHIAGLPRQQQIRNPDQCDENACYGEGEPVDLFHCMPTEADDVQRRLSMFIQDADKSSPSASAHTLNSCFNSTVEVI